MEITATQVKELRDRTGAGMMECKKALSECQGNVDRAIEHLRKQGNLKAAKRSERTTSEGLIAEAVGKNQSEMALVELDCETDFVARTDQFTKFVHELAQHVLQADPKSIEELLQQKFKGQPQATVQAVLTVLIQQTGENVTLKRFARLKTNGGQEVLASYVHPGNKIGVIVKIKTGQKGLSETAAREIAMHIAAMNPLYLSPADVPAEIAEQEKAIFQANPDIQGKPENVAKNIVEGRYRKFLSEACLLQQIFIKDSQGKNSVEKFLQSQDPGATVLDFVRYQVGESDIH